VIDRRKFLTILSGVVAATGANNAGMRAATAAEVMPHGAIKGGAANKVYTFFTADEVAFIRAVVARLIPADDLGPGALEADVPYFIDQQLAGVYGAGARFYSEGPFGAQTPFQGYQWPLSPAELYQVGIAATDQYCEQTYHKRFVDLDPGKQDEVLNGLQGIAGAVDLKDIPGTPFFTQLLSDTKDGFFADPVYGGNKDMVGWKLVGFPGVAADYAELITRHNQPYVVEPVDIRAIKQADIDLDHHGHPVHRRADASRIRPTAAPSPSGGSKVATEWRAAQSFFL
jgi:gluconate 2-dehydrogenase gamma chain